VPAHAATIHKSQGSEYPAVIIPLRTQHYPMLQRNLLYTSLTRGQRLVVLVGQKKAIAIAVRKSPSGGGGPNLKNGSAPRRSRYPNDSVTRARIAVRPRASEAHFVTCTSRLIT